MILLWPLPTKLHACPPSLGNLRRAVATAAERGQSSRSRLQLLRQRSRVNRRPAPPPPFPPYRPPPLPPYRPPPLPPSLLWVSSYSPPLCECPPPPLLWVSSSSPPLHTSCRVLLLPSPPSLLWVSSPPLPAVCVSVSLPLSVFVPGPLCTAPWGAQRSKCCLPCPEEADD